MLAVLDYGIGNVRSVLNAFEYLGIKALLTRDHKAIERASGLVLPGVGAFGEGMRRIDGYALRPALDLAFAQRKPILGICLGFELLMRSSDELGVHEGLGYFPLDVAKLKTEERLPHIGWTPVRSLKGPPSAPRLMHGIEGESFYFVHSFGVGPDPRFTCSTAHYGSAEIVAVIEHEHVFGAQFHPEKSGDAGLQLLRNFSGLTQ